jgi:hypothetical protein
LVFAIVFWHNSIFILPVPYQQLAVKDITNFNKRSCFYLVL